MKASTPPAKPVPWRVTAYVQLGLHLVPSRVLEAVRGRHRAGESVAELADDYDLTVEFIASAIRGGEVVVTAQSWFEARDLAVALLGCSRDDVVSVVQLEHGDPEWP